MHVWEVMKLIIEDWTLVSRRNMHGRWGGRDDANVRVDSTSLKEKRGTKEVYLEVLVEW